VKVPVEELLAETCHRWLDANMHALDATRHVKLHAMIRPGSRDLVELYLRQQQTGVSLANDTSCGVGYAPLDALEQVVYEVEMHLNSPAIKSRYPAIGEDIKVMGVRRGKSVALTLACAFIDRHIPDVEGYRANKAQVAALAEDIARSRFNAELSVDVNTADDEAAGSLYLTVTGTSAEAGDDGEVGRGNRVNGLITPYRPMNMEAAAGKNPVTHVGKLYNIAARRMCETLVQDLQEIEEAQCYLVSRIGQPVCEPQVVDLRLQLREGIPLSTIEARVREVSHAHLADLPAIQDMLLEGAISIY
jgi:S-adenosylmethionine synthetase